MAGSQETQEELDPNIEYIRKRMMKMMMISIGILSIGLLALLFAIIYKVKIGSKNKQTEVVTQSAEGGDYGEHGKKHHGKKHHDYKHHKLAENIEIDIPDGVTLITSKVQRGRMILELSSEDEMLFWIVDLHSGEVVSRITLK